MVMNQRGYKSIQRKKHKKKTREIRDLDTFMKVYMDFFMLPWNYPWFIPSYSRFKKCRSWRNRCSNHQGHLIITPTSKST